DSSVMNLAEQPSVTQALGDRAQAAAAAAQHLTATAVDPAATVAAAAALVAEPRPSLKKRTWDKIASHVERVNELHEDNSDDFHVEFANDAIRVFQGLISGRCISGPLISNLNNLCHAHSEDDDVGTQALLLLGRAIRKAAESRNEQFTTASGLVAGRYGLPELQPPKPPLPRTESESPEHREDPMSHLFVEDREIKKEQPEEENLCFTSGLYIGNNASYVDISSLVPFQRFDKDVDDYSDSRMAERRMQNDRFRPINAPFKPFDYKYDNSGNLLVKSEMMGDDEFFDHQVNLRRIGAKYEQIARRGIYEERFIMKHIGTGYERKRYECDQCGIICANQHKYASHVRHAHPKSEKERAEIAKIKAERAAELKEEKRKKDALLPKQPTLERERRERRPLGRGNSGGNLMPTTFTTPAPSDKIYVCPICDEEVASQHVFASHMRYNHPKDGTTTSMAGRRATVKRIIKEEPEDSMPTTIDTPESALNALSSVLSAHHHKPMPVIRRTKTLPDGTGAYKCRVCGRTFDNLNACAGHTRHCIAAHGAAPSPPKPVILKPQLSHEGDDEIEDEEEMEMEEDLEDDPSAAEAGGPYRCRVCSKVFNNPNSVAGHTRHCLAAHGGEPSPRALARRKAKSQHTPLPTHIIKTEPLPPSPLALVPPSSVAAIVDDSGGDVIRHLRPKKPAAPTANPVPGAPESTTKSVKVEPLDESNAAPSKPPGRTTRNSAAAALDQAELQHHVEMPQTAPAASIVEGGRRPTRASITAPMPAATSTTPTPVNGSMPSTRPMPVRSSVSRSSARLMSPSGSEAAASQPLLSISPLPSKRPRTSSGHADREIKREPMDDEDSKADKRLEMAMKIIDKELDEAEEASNPRRRLSKADKKAAKAAFRGFETEAARSCYYCHIQCTTMHAGDRHIRIKHPGREQIYSCSECGSAFLTLGGLENHWTKSEYCPNGFVMVAGRSIFDLDEEVKRRPLEVKQKGLNMDGEVEMADITGEEDEINKEMEKIMKEVRKVEKPQERRVEKKEEKKIDKSPVMEKKVEKLVVEKKEEKKEPKLEKSPIVLKKIDKPAEKVIEKREERRSDRSTERKSEKREEKKKEEHKVEKPAEKAAETKAVKKETPKRAAPVKVKEEQHDESYSPSGPSSHTPPAIISLASTRSGANRQRKTADRFDPDPTSQRYSSLSK
ncbi:hypothetical protein PMAYCL1PPCAC_32013, partial [Pristionchus mayeri]